MASNSRLTTTSAFLDRWENASGAPVSGAPAPF
jgi:hypothetical protein